MIIFFTTVIIAACAVAGLITLRLTAQTNLPLWIISLTFIVIFLAFLSPFLLRDTASSRSGPAYLAFIYTAYFLFVMVFLFFSFMLVRDIGWIILHAVFPDKIPSAFQASAIFKANLVLLGIVFCLATYSLFEGMRVPAVRYVTLTSPKLTEPLTIAVLSDIHIHRALPKNKLQGIIARTNALKPDIIALPGDIIDDRADAIRDLVPLLAELKAKYGVFVTDGNHEVYIAPTDAHQQFMNAGLIYLQNKSSQLTPFLRIAGVPDTQFTRIGRPPKMTEALADTRESVYTILLAHSPKMFDLEGNTADLQLSGHTHGGQIFPFHILTKIANKYLAGVYTKGNRTLYVSRGAGQWGPQMRLFSPSEITFITINPASSHK